MGIKHARANKDSLRISPSTYWQTEEKLSLTATSHCLHSSPFLKSSSVLVHKCFYSLSSPSCPMPLVKKSTKSNPLAQDRRSIILVQITDLHQDQQHLPAMMLYVRKARVSPWHEYMCEERVPLYRPSQKAEQVNNSYSEYGKLTVNLLDPF